MTVTKANFGDKITSAIFNENTYYLLKGTAGYEDTVRLADNVDSTFLLQPNTDPGAPAQLFQIKTANGTLKGAFDSSGNLIAAGTASVNGLFAATATINTLSVPTINTTNVTGMTAGTLVVSGEASINTLFASTATIGAGDAALGTLRVSGQASVNTLMATGAATFAGNVNVEGTLTAVGNLSYTNLTITGTASVGNLQVAPGGNSNVLALIQEISTTASPTIVSFTSIPQNFKHLRVVGRGAFQGAGDTSNYLYMRFNNDSGANYSYYGIGQAVGSGNSNYAWVTPMPDSGLAPSLASAFTVDIPDYTSSLFYKNAIVHYAGQQLIFGLGIYGNEWKSTAAITQIDFSQWGKTLQFASGFTVSLLGLP